MSKLVGVVLLLAASCAPPIDPVKPPGALTASFAPDGEAGAAVVLREAHRDGAAITLDIETELSEPISGVAWGLAFDPACLELDRFEATGELAAPVWAARPVGAGTVIGVATFRGRSGGAEAGKRQWGRLHFRALKAGGCPVRFDVERSQARGPEGKLLTTAWVGGTVSAE